MTNMWNVPHKPSFLTADFEHKAVAVKVAMEKFASPFLNKVEALTSLIQRSAVSSAASNHRITFLISDVFQS